VSCAEHAMHQTKNDEPRWGPDGGQKHATRPRAQALRAPRLNDSLSLFLSLSLSFSLSFLFATSARCAVYVRAAYALRGFAERIHEYRVHRDKKDESAIVRARDVEKRNRIIARQKYVR